MSGRANTKSQVRALLWEEGRVGGAIACACLAVGLFLLSIYYRAPNAWTHDEFTTHFAAFGVPILTAFLLILNPDTSGHLVGGFSRRVLRLPVQTHLAVAVVLAARTTLVLVVSATLVGLSSVLFEDAPGLAVAVLITLLYLVAQLADWLRGPISGLTSLIVLGVLGTIAYTLWPGTPEVAPIEWGLSAAGRSPVILPIAFFTVLAGAYGTSVVAVHADRVGRRYGIPEIWEWPKRITVSGRARTTPFRSPMAAQVWFEVRRSKWSLPLSAALTFVIVFAAAWVAVHSNRSEYDDGEALSRVSSLGLFACVLVGAGGHGVLTRVLGFRKPAGKSGYEYLQPLTDAQFAAARVYAGALMLLPTLVGALAIHFAVGGRLVVTEMIPEELRLGSTSSREVVWIVVSRLLLGGLFAWSLLAIGTRFFRIAAPIVGGSALAVAMSLATVLHSEGFTKNLVDQLTVVFMLLVIAVTAGMIAIAMGRRILSRAGAIAWIVAWLLLAWLFRYALVTAWATHSMSAWEHAVCTLTALGCSTPFPLVYLAILSDVHRRRRGAIRAQDESQHRRAAPLGRAAVPGAVALALVAVGAIWLGWPADPAYVEYRKGQGQPATLAELNAWYPEPAAGENVAPEYLKAAEETMRLHGAAAAERLRVSRNVGGALGYVLPRAELIDKALWDATELYWAEVTSKAAPGLKALAARDTRQSRYPVDYTDEDYYSEFNHVRMAYEGVAQLELDALHWAVAGRPGDAADSIVAILALAQSLSNEPSLWIQRSRPQLLVRASRAVEIVLNRSVPSEADLDRLQRAFAECSVFEKETRSTDRGIVGETTMHLDPDSFYNHVYSRERSLPTALLLNLAYPPAGQRLTLHYEEHEAIDQLRKPWGQARAAMGATYRRRGFLLPWMMGYFGDYAWTSYSEGQTRVELGIAQVALAVERYRWAKQALPESLAELVPVYLSEVPEDFFAASPGTSLRYEVRESGEYLVYSVDYDMDDDLGDDLGDEDNNGRRDGDIAFTVAPMSFRTGPQIAAQ